jgi:FdhE protein
MAGFLGEEGRRMLLCHWCGHLWNFARVKCPFCQTADHRQLRYLSFGAASPYRVDVCDHCRGYLKTADGRNIPGDLLLEAEDLLTPHLDLVAAREGFLRKAPGVLGLLR